METTPSSPTAAMASETGSQIPRVTGHKLKCLGVQRICQRVRMSPCSLRFLKFLLEKGVAYCPLSSDVASLNNSGIIITIFLFLTIYFLRQFS